MAYLDVYTLAEAKNSLRIDDTLTEDDARITRIINGALAHIEQWTNVMLYARDKTYKMVDGCVKVYDAPINSVTTADVVAEEKTLYTNYTLGTTTTDLVLNVGHVVPADVPQALKDVAEELIDLMYYEHETGKTVSKDLSSLSIGILDRYKRFVF